MAEILVVDDDKITRKTVGIILRNAGHHVVFASDGAKALSVLGDNPQVAIIVTDVVMPVLDGRELVAALRRNKSFAQIPTIIMSAMVKVSEIRSLLEAGAERFLAKPIDKERLIEEVEAILLHSRRGDEVASLVVGL